MKVTMEIECTTEEFQDLFVPSEKQDEFIRVTYDAYVDALSNTVMRTIDPHNFLGMKNGRTKKESTSK